MMYQEIAKKIKNDEVRFGEIIAQLNQKSQGQWLQDFDAHVLMALGMDGVQAFGPQPMRGARASESTADYLAWHYIESWIEEMSEHWIADRVLDIRLNGQWRIIE